MAAFEPFAADLGDRGMRLCIHTPARGAPRGAVLHVHAFMEEMNKSRRMSALGARALAASGFSVLQIDLHGCGDSSGELAQVSWDGWLRDLEWAVAWLQRRHAAPLTLWGHRAGALLCTALAARLAQPCDLLFWNPVVQGKGIVQQLLRMKAAAHWASGDGKAAVEQVKAQLAAGLNVEIGGYELSPALVRDLEAASLVAPPGNPAVPRRLAWLEASGSADDAALTPAAQAHLARWQAAGWTAQGHAVPGPAFWQTVEIEDAPALVQATVAAMLGPSKPPTPGAQQTTRGSAVERT